MQDAIFLKLTAHRRLSFIRELYLTTQLQLKANKELHDYDFGHSYNKSLDNINNESSFLLTYSYVEYLLSKIAIDQGHTFKNKESRLISSIEFFMRQCLQSESQLKMFSLRFDCYRRIRNSVAHEYGLVKNSNDIEQIREKDIHIVAANGEYLLDHDFMSAVFSDSDRLIQSIIDILLNMPTTNHTTESVRIDVQANDR